MHELPTLAVPQTSGDINGLVHWLNVSYWKPLLLSLSELSCCLVLLLTPCSCSKSVDSTSSSSTFDACYRRCIAPDTSGCPTDHEWCTVVCASGHDPIARVMPHTGADNVAPTAERARLTNTIAIETLGGVASPIIKRCVDLPFDVAEVFSTSEPNQQTIEVHLVAGDAPKAGDNQTLGRFTFLGVRPAPAAIPRIQVRFRVEKSGRLTVTARDLDTNQDLRVLQGGTLP